MSDMIMIEPDGPHRQAFARWCLAQDPPIQTAGHSGSLVPVGLYPAVPPELLEGAYVDGYLYGRPQTTAEAPKAPEEAPVAPEAPQPARKRRNRQSSGNGGAE